MKTFILAVFLNNEEFSDLRSFKQAHAGSDSQASPV